MTQLKISQNPSLVEMREALIKMINISNSLTSIQVVSVDANAAPRFVISSDQSRLDYPIISQ